MRKGVIIHEAVNTAHRGWSSTKVKKVAKSVDTSVKETHISIFVKIISTGFSHLYPTLSSTVKKLKI